MLIKYFQYTILTFFYFAAMSTTFVAAQDGKQKFTMSVSHPMTFHQTKPFIVEFVEKIYKPLKIDVELTHYANSRGLSLVNKGILDADLSRFSSVAKPYKNLLKVPTPINHMKYYYFCLQKKDCNFDSEIKTLVPESVLKSRKFCQNNKLDCRYLKKSVSLFKALQKGYGGRVLSSMFTTPVCQTDIKKLYRKEITSLSLEQYHYVHKKHQALIPQIDNQIKRLQKIDLLEPVRQKLINKIWSCDIELVDL